jgi:hypothetical protein
MLNCCRAPALAFKNASVFHLHPVLLHSPLSMYQHSSFPTILLRAYLSLATAPSVKIAFNSHHIYFATRYCSYQHRQPICRLVSRANSHRSWATQLASSSKVHQKIFSSDLNTRSKTAVTFCHSPSEATIRLADAGKFSQPETDFERQSPSPVHTITHLPAHCVSLVLLQQFSGL